MGGTGHHRSHQGLQAKTRRGEHGRTGSRLTSPPRRSRLKSRREWKPRDHHGRAGPVVYRPHPAPAGFPAHHHLWKVIVWDKVLGLGSTDPITGMVAHW